MSEEATPALDKWFGSILFFLLVLVVGMRPFVPDSKTTFSLHLVVNLLILAAVTVFILRQLLTNRLRIAKTGLELPAVVFLVAILISISVAAYKRPAILTGYSWTCYILLFFVIANSVRGTERRVLIWVLVASVFVVSMHGVHQRLFEIPAIRAQLKARPDEVRELMGLPAVPLSEVWGRLEGNKVFSTFTLSNSLAGFLGMMFPVQIALLLSVFRREGRRRVSLILCGFATVAALTCLYLTRSKGGWLASLVGLAILFVWLFRGFLRRHRAAVAAVLVGLLIILLMAQLLNLMPPLRDYPSSFKVRYGYWRAGTKMIARKPLIGGGLGSWPDRYSIYKLPEDQETRKTHNDYIQLWVEMGLIGLGAYLWFWCAFFLATRTSRSSNAPERAPPGDESRRPLILAAFAGLAVFLAVFLSSEPALGSPVGPCPWIWLLGLWLGWTVLVLHAPLRAGDGGWADRTLAVGISAGLAAFLLHEIMDFDLYVEGIAQTALTLAGLLVARQLELQERKRYLVDLRPGTLGAAILMPVCIVSLIFMSFRFTVPILRAEKLSLRARSLSESLSDVQRAALLEAGLTLDPRNAETALGLSQLYMRLWNRGVPRLRPGGRNTLALATDRAQEAARLDPIRWSYQIQLARLYELQWRARRTAALLDACIKYYGAAYNLFPSNPILAAYLARQYERKGDSVAALKMYNRALELDSFQYHHERRKLKSKDRLWVMERIAALEKALESERP